MHLAEQALDEQMVVVGRNNEILRPECFLTVNNHVIARTECDSAFVGRWVKGRDIELTEVGDSKRRDIDMVGSQTWSRSADSLTEILDPVVTAVEVKNEVVIPSLDVAKHHLSVAPHVVVSGAAGQRVVAAASVAGHRLRITDEKGVKCTGRRRSGIIASDQSVVAALCVA